MVWYSHLPTDPTHSPQNKSTNPTHKPAPNVTYAAIIFREACCSFKSVVSWNKQSSWLILIAVKQILMYGHCGSAPTDLMLRGFSDHISLMKEQFIITHTLRQSEIPGWLDSWVKNTPSVEMLCPQKMSCPFIFIKIQTHLHVGLLWVCPVCFLCPVELCVGELQQIALSRVIWRLGASTVLLT